MVAAAMIVGPGALLVVLLILLTPIVAVGLYFDLFWFKRKK
jgi:hypothetical protein